LEWLTDTARPQVAATTTLGHQAGASTGDLFSIGDPSQINPDFAPYDDRNGQQSDLRRRWLPTEGTSSSALIQIVIGD